MEIASAFRPTVEQLLFILTYTQISPENMINLIDPFALAMRGLPIERGRV